MDSREGLSKVLHKVCRALFRDDPTYYDMYENPGEGRMGKIYLNHIEETIRTETRGISLSILDAGCQSGRLSIPLGLAGHRVTGVDTSGVGLRRAKRHARENAVNLKLIRADLTRWLPAQPPEQFDAVICTEVLYLRDNYRQLLEGLVRIAKKGGLIFISHRPSGYYLAEAFEHKDLESVRTLLARSEGQILGSYYNWQEAKELETLYRNLGLKIAKIVPMGELNPLPSPEQLNQEGRDLLQEARAQGRFDLSGRYLLVCAKKC